ncbi:TPA_asm: RNA-directed RNA polymerase [ssRNA phage Zoerhiza.4_19]|uniref:RNA-directed RNA polymerase n=2 Tax=Leviviricetes TaxID=2842243 RepID=A0A8S5KZ38_9VIRU|nr:RNA-directed RNA polymerase [ssRNA phage Zoerhiza.4_19]QDH89342.1 MAG: RNA-dependent RNA polymerase [Leviviridae sp.]DAD50568.1 TPA_asm: RNA-directed RNA polymerase [ssRNA phage Zoerhiza.4_19]
MKSQLHSLLHVTQGLFKDVRAAFPSLRGLELDLENLSSNCRTRGLGFFTLDLPNLDSMLLRGLEVGRLSLEGPLSRAVSKRCKVPRFLSGLWLRVFDNCGYLKPDADVNAIAFLRQLSCLGKKIAVECSSDRIQSTLENYHDIERTLRRPSFDWGSDWVEFCETAGDHHLGDCLGFPDPNDLFYLQEKEEEVSCGPGDRALLEQVQLVADLLSDSLGYLDPLLFSEQLELDGQGIGFRHGPGAVADRVRQWEKSHFRTWPAKLEGRFPYQYCGRTANSDLEAPINHELPSRLICVPKTAKSPRLIAAEPTEHQWCQQLVLSFLSRAFRCGPVNDFVDLHDQSKSADMVLQASRTQKLATVDLSDASDRVSCWTVERIFRRNTSILTALHAARTRYIRDDISSVPGFLKTKKFASQGTATTFPVMSFIMLCVALGACIGDGPADMEKIRRLRGQVRIFGDDIIIPKYGYVRLCRVMTLLQLKINSSKSYWLGHFRESCGQDGFMGYDVTPIKPKTLVADGPASCQAVVDTSNNLHNKGYWNAADSCRALLPVFVQRNLGISGRDDAGYPGLTSFSGGDERHLVKRWNSRLHRNEVRVWTIFSPPQQEPREGFGVLLDFMSSKWNIHSPRVVSVSVRSRRTVARLSWEPSRQLTSVPLRYAPHLGTSEWRV